MSGGRRKTLSKVVLKGFALQRQRETLLFAARLGLRLRWNRSLFDVALDLVANS
jgi:hypothetical protein